jgi:hypothetical protein
MPGTREEQALASAALHLDDTENDVLTKRITATEAASHCGVALCTITKWVREERIKPVGVNAAGRKLYLLLDVCKAEHATRRRAGRAA